MVELELKVGSIVAIPFGLVSFRPRGVRMYKARLASPLTTTNRGEVSTKKIETTQESDKELTAAATKIRKKFFQPSQLN